VREGKSLPSGLTVPPQDNEVRVRDAKTVARVLRVIATEDMLAALDAEKALLREAEKKLADARRDLAQAREDVSTAAAQLSAAKLENASLVERMGQQAASTQKMANRLAELRQELTAAKMEVWLCSSFFLFLVCLSSFACHCLSFGFSLLMLCNLKAIGSPSLSRPPTGDSSSTTPTSSVPPTPKEVCSFPVIFSLLGSLRPRKRAWQRRWASGWRAPARSRAARPTRCR
jgi:hypothetical protein